MDWDHASIAGEPWPLLEVRTHKYLGALPRGRLLGKFMVRTRMTRCRNAGWRCWVWALSTLS